MLLLRLYIAGGSREAEEIEARVRAAVADAQAPEGCLEVVDVLDRPDLAWKDGVHAAPTLARISPEPARRIVGDLRWLRESGAFREMLRAETEDR